MTSRSILIAAAFSLACTVLLGSALLQLAVGSGIHSQPMRSNDEMADEGEAVFAPSSTADESNAGQRAARQLEELLRKSETVIAARRRTREPSRMNVPDGFGDSDAMDAEYPDSPYAAMAMAESSPLPEEAIVLFAEMVRIIDETAGYRFVIEIADSDLRLARQRSDVFQNSLLLALRDPSKLRIEEVAASLPEVRVRAIELSRVP